MVESIDWGKRAEKGFLASGIDPADRRGHKNCYIDLLQRIALEEILDLKGDEHVLDFGCGRGRMAYWIAPKVKKVVGLEDTPEMVQMAEANRKADNVDLVLYDGVHFPNFPWRFDLVLSVGVLQYMRDDLLQKTVFELARYLKKDGKGYFIEQASDNPEIGRPNVQEYLQAFSVSKLECLQYYPIRSGRSWLLYLIRYGLIPEKWFGQIARHELRKRRGARGFIRHYQDFLFVLRQGR